MHTIRGPHSANSTPSGDLRLRLSAKIWGLLLVAGGWVVLSGCHKEAATPTDIFGQWQWISDVGGVTGKEVYTPTTTNYDRTYQFNRDSTFVECANSHCNAAVKFSSRMEKSLFDGQQHLILTIPRKVYLARPDTGYVILKARYRILELGAKLRLAQEVFDGYESSYSRK